MLVSVAVEKAAVWSQGNRELGLEYFSFSWNWEFVLLCTQDPHLRVKNSGAL